jgi:hypothetical protein
MLESHNLGCVTFYAVIAAGMATDPLPTLTPAASGNVFSTVRESLLIAGFTAGAYWFAFKYETGYLSAYGLPPYLAEVSLQSTMLWLLALVTITFTWLLLVNVLVMFWPENPILRRKLAPVGIFGLFLLWHLFAFGFRKQDWAVYLILGLVIVVFTAIEFISSKFPSTKPEPTSAVDWLAAKFGRSSVFLVVAFSPRT